MLKFFRRPKSKNISNKTNDDSNDKSSKKSAPKNPFKIQISQKIQNNGIYRALDAEQNYMPSNACVSSSNADSNIVINKIDDKHIRVDLNTNVNLLYYENEQHQFPLCSANNSTTHTSDTTIITKAVPKECNYNLKKCEDNRRKSSNLFEITHNKNNTNNVSSRNEIVDETSACLINRIENVPSNRSICIDRIPAETATTLCKSNEFEQKDKLPNQKNKISWQKTFNPINKSREFLSHIIMAKGRNRNRNKNNNNNSNGSSNSKSSSNFINSNANIHHNQGNKSNSNNNNISVGSSCQKFDNSSSCIKQQYKRQRDQDQQHKNLKRNANHLNNESAKDNNLELENSNEVTISVKNNDNSLNRISDEENLKIFQQMSEENNNDDVDVNNKIIGYQITKSKNSIDLVMKCSEEIEKENHLQNERDHQENENSNGENIGDNNSLQIKNDHEIVNCNNGGKNGREHNNDEICVDDTVEILENFDKNNVFNAQLNDTDHDDDADEEEDDDDEDEEKDDDDDNEICAGATSLNVYGNNLTQTQSQNFKNISDYGNDKYCDDELHENLINTTCEENIVEKSARVISLPESEDDANSLIDDDDNSDDDYSVVNDDDDDDLDILAIQQPEQNSIDQFPENISSDSTETEEEISLATTTNSSECDIETNDMGQQSSKSSSSSSLLSSTSATSNVIHATNAFSSLSNQSSCNNESSCNSETNSSDNSINSKNEQKISYSINCDSEKQIGENIYNANLSNNIVIPEITVADFSDQQQSPIKNDNEIFYDSTSNPNQVHHNDIFKQTLSPSMIPKPQSSKNSSIESTSTIDIIDLDDDDEEEDEWHFVNSTDNDRVTIDENENDPFNADHKLQFNKTNANKKQFLDDTSIDYSTSSISTIETITNDKYNDSPDSGFGSTMSRVLLIDSSQLESDNRNYQCDSNEIQQPSNEHDQQGQSKIHYIRIETTEEYVRGGSTDCEDNLLPNDNETSSATLFDDHQEQNQHNKEQQQQQQKEQEIQQEHYQKQHILIDSISLPDVVVESTGMGNLQSIPIKAENISTNNSNNRSSPLQATASKSSSETEITATKTINNDHISDNEKRNLVNQEARFSAQLEEAQKIAYAAQSKVNDLQTKIDDLEKELSTKSWHIDRLQGELKAAQKEDEYVRKKLKVIEEEKETIRIQFSECEDDLKSRYEELLKQHQDLQDKYEDLKMLINALKAQLTFAQSDAKQCRQEKNKLEKEKDEEIKSLKEALEKSQEDQKQLEQKWQKEFESLRTQNAEREEHLMSDCEWKMRSMQKSCKEKLENAEKERKEAIEKSIEIETKANAEMEEVKHLRSYEAEVKCLRGLTSEQRSSINLMTKQIEDLRQELENVNEQLEEQIDTVRKIRIQCDNALNDKDRQMIQKIDEIRGEIAEQWENKLMAEMTRLKSELEILSVEDRQDLIQRFQAEHIEEIKALTTRYNANEQELRDELESVKQQLADKENEFRKFRNKSEAMLLESRLQLERADRDYQCAINREEEKKERLTENLRREFEEEKEEMEEKFRERLGHVKDEFARELAAAAEEMEIQHRKRLKQQWEELTAEKEEALQEMEMRQRHRLEDAEHRIRDLEIEHQRDLKQIKANYEIDRTSLESRDMKNSQEIEQLHRKCRCLTNLFEEMRMRYERRDPRPEDLREIAELRSRCEAQERDLHLLTERLREMQIEMQEQQQQPSNQGRRKSIKKPPPKNIPISCDVIYEENEENESSPPPSPVSPNSSVSQDRLRGSLPKQYVNNSSDNNNSSDSNHEILNGTTKNYLNDNTTNYYENSTGIVEN